MEDRKAQQTAADQYFRNAADRPSEKQTKLLKKQNNLMKVFYKTLRQ
jgi:hypothetical protein